jgi:hypothetical protein
MVLAKAYRNMMENGLERASYFDWNTDSCGLFGLDYHAKPHYYTFRMYAALGRFKQSTLLNAGNDNPALTATVCRHEDGQGYSVLLASDNVFVGTTTVSVDFPGVKRAYTVKSWRLLPETRFEELPEAAAELAQPLSGVLAGREVRLVVLRQQ